MNVRYCCAEYYLLSETKTTRYLKQHPSTTTSTKGVLTDLRARNFVHAKTSLSARCVHVPHRVRNLLIPVIQSIFQPSC